MAEGLWTKVKRTVVGFVKGAVQAAPMTLLYSGAAFGISAGLGHVAGASFDFLNVGHDATKIATRLMGSMVIGSTISGAINGYNAYSTPDTLVADSSPGQKPQKSSGLGHSKQLGMNDVMPPSTPHHGRDQRAQIS